MKKTITLNEKQMEMLKNWMKTDQDLLELADQCVASKGGLAGFRVANIRFEDMRNKRDREAYLLVASLQMSFVAEQGPRVNPEETAGDAGTPA